MAGSPYLGWLSKSLTSETAGTVAAPGGQDAVLGYAVGYDVSDIAPFVRSLRAVYSGTIILAVDRRPNLLAWLSTHGVEALIASERLMHWSPHPVIARFAVYAQILQERRDLRRVVTTDVSDVVFQSDPFTGAKGDLQFFLESDVAGPADHASHLRHLQALVGDGLAKDLGQRDRVTADIVAGQSAAVLRFCRTMLLMCAIPRSRIGGAPGADQAACNVIAHLGLAGGEIRPNYGRVATIDSLAPPGLRTDSACILNPDGGCSPIVHRYDRIPALASRVQALWGLPGFGRSRRLQRLAEALGGALLRRVPELR